MKYRIKITQMATLVLLLIAKPFSWKLFIAGLVIISLGEAIRLWASGYLKKDKELAVTGPYRIVRHPLYVGSFLIALGFTLI
ncbi:MAG TPA: methyltransferase, partial [Elusimicrobiales bacterium]|nr:methyltransferase [Elusimicrobiales bacterium]